MSSCKWAKFDRKVGLFRSRETGQFLPFDDRTHRAACRNPDTHEVEAWLFWDDPLPELPQPEIDPNDPWGEFK